MNKHRHINSPVLTSANLVHVWSPEPRVGPMCALTVMSFFFVLLSAELDVFGVCLYSMLTFMSSVSLLLYLEQCVYIYKKLPSPKKTIIMWINGAAPVSTGGRRRR